MFEIRPTVTDISALTVDTLLAFVYQGDEQPTLTSALNSTLNDVLGELKNAGDFEGAAGKSAVVYPRGMTSARRVIFVGLGEAAALNAEGLRRAAAVGLLKAKELKAVDVAAMVPSASGLSAGNAAQAIVEGAGLALYDYRGQKTGEDNSHTVASLTLAVASAEDSAAVDAGAARGEIFASGTHMARDLKNLPPNICTAEYLAEQAQKMAKTYGLSCEVLGKQQITALKMGAFLGVAQGSDSPPRFIILQHNADKAKDLDTVVLVGKGVTFDTGGYSIKTADGMVGMKLDMGGAAAVLGAMKIVARLGLPLHVVGLVPAVDNMISGHAYRPQDVLVASNGKTIEVISTDAEGRLLLADALVYARRFEPAAVVDIATLTGACVVALGNAAAGFFATDDGLVDVLNTAADGTNERVWRLPLYPEYLKSLESATADVKNTGGRLGGVGSSAVFLQQFVDYPAWAHIDMAGVMQDLPDNPCFPKGASGFGARLLARFAYEWAVKKQNMEAWR